MVSVQELAERLTHALALIASARVALAQARELVGEATQAWAAVTSGTVDPEAAQLPARGEAEAAGLAAQFATLQRAEQALRAYPDALGVGEVAPSGPPPPGRGGQVERTGLHTVGRHLARLTGGEVALQLDRRPVQPVRVPRQHDGYPTLSDRGPGRS